MGQQRNNSGRQLGRVGLVVPGSLVEIASEWRFGAAWGRAMPTNLHATPREYRTPPIGRSEATQPDHAAHEGLALDTPELQVAVAVTLTVDRRPRVFRST